MKLLHPSLMTIFYTNNCSPFTLAEQDSGSPVSGPLLPMGD